jgi:hypothetical protein
MHILMNNCYANYGSTNARELAALLVEELAAEPGRAPLEPVTVSGPDTPDEQQTPGATGPQTPLTQM